MPVKTTTGNWLTWRRDGVFSVTPERREHGFVVRDAGWRDIVHLMSHYVHRRKRPTHKPHAATHAFLEKEMIEHVVRSGRLEGKLKRPEKAPEPEPTATE